MGSGGRDFFSVSMDSTYCMLSSFKVNATERKKGPLMFCDDCKIKQFAVKVLIVDQPYP